MVTPRDGKNMLIFKKRGGGTSTVTKIQGKNKTGPQKGVDFKQEFPLTVLTLSGLL